ncbi:MAG: FlgD immunoglobulin-like domain containing protein, partial [Candidatus Krumholzibacteria bacterium]|nr:FlgD immunoglobulin-like domain containing protein [Candidatus Krumholzibacteria bacterium]
SSPQISDTEISGNLSLGYGGGIAYLDQSGGFLQNCKILNNVASNDFSVGGGISTNQSNPDIDGCLITGNSVPGAWGEGGGIDASFTPAPSISYCTIVGNSTGSGGTGGGIASQFDAAPSIYRSIIAFADNGLGVSCLYGSTPLLSCNDIYGNPGGDAVCGTDGGSNFSSDPLFCGTEGVEYNLQADSPCAAANNDCEVTLGSEPEDCSVDVVEGPLSAARLLGNAPNPFNPKTGIFFVLDTQGHASLRIHDIAGRLVKDLSPGSLPAGNHRVDWNGLDESGQLVPSGVYFYTLKALGLEQSRRMILIK